MNKLRYQKRKKVKGRYILLFLIVIFIGFGIVWSFGSSEAELNSFPTEGVETTEVSAGQIKDQQKKADQPKFRIVIDAGHGGKDPGAIGASGAYEKDFNLSLANQLYHLLEQEPLFDTRLTREDDQFIKLEDRAALANDWKADVLVSIHGNTFDDPTVTGTETIYYNPESKELAEVLQEQVAAALDIRDRGLKREELIILTSSKVPSVVIEVGYLTNPKEEKLLLSSDGQDRAANAIFKGLKNYFSDKTSSEQSEKFQEDSLSIQNQDEQQIENKIYFSGKREEGKYLALTFDDGPNRNVTPKILDILKKNDIKATFFVLGNQVSDNTDILERILQEGHVIGNHSWSHPNFDNISIEEAEMQIVDTQKVLENKIGYRPSLFRPPYGALDNNKLKLVNQMNMAAINWTVDTMDWSGISSEEIIELVRKQLYPGGIVLMHDSERNNNATNTIDALEEMIPELKEKGYSFVTVPELLNLPTSQSVAP